MKKFFLRVFVVVTLFLASTYFFGCLTPYVSPVTFWPMAFLALGFPYIAVLILALAFSWIFVNKRVACLLLLLLLIGVQNLSVTFALHPVKKSTLAKAPGSIRILTWNLRGFDNPSIGLDTMHSVRKQMFNYIARVNPDVLCLQEFAEHCFKGVFSNTDDLKKLGYVYVNRTDESKYIHDYGTVLSGTAIFSKLPFSSGGKVMLGDSSHPENLAFADVSADNKTIRIFATHFKSLNLFALPPDNKNRVRFYGDSNFVYVSSRFTKIKSFAQAHAKEAFIAKEAIEKSPYPVVIGIDMNSVPTSYPYHRMSAGLNDAFQHEGWGLGTTMYNFPKTLRIDYLLVDKRLLIANFGRDEINLSDHFPQFIDVK